MATKKSAWEKSKFGKINIVDVFNGIYASIVAVGTLYFTEPTSELKTMAILAGSTFFFALFGGASTNSEGKLFKKEP